MSWTTRSRCAQITNDHHGEAPFFPTPYPHTTFPLQYPPIQIEEYLRGLALPKTVYLHTAFFYENVATKRGTHRVKVRGWVFLIDLMNYTWMGRSVGRSNRDT